MARLNLFAEGQTEQTFADEVLKPHLAKFGVYMRKPLLIESAKKKGRIYRGGGQNFNAMQDDIQRLLNQESGSGVFFTTMIDLYALHRGFLGVREADKLRNEPYKRVKALEKSWLDETGDPRFIPFIQLHEFEAYLFVDVSRFALFFEAADSRISALRETAKGVSSPELIDDGRDTAPSKRIIALFPEYEHRKITVGAQMARRIDLGNIRSKCPHFNGWVERLEKLGSGPQARS